MAAKPCLCGHGKGDHHFSKYLRTCSVATCSCGRYREAPKPAPEALAC